jgi:hypothetical protein
MIKPENYNALLQDLRNKTGFDIHRFQINRIDFLRDMVNIKVYFFEKKQKSKKNK